SGWDFSAKQRRFRDETGSADTGDRQKDDEAVYVYPAEAGGHARIRIFTPMDELPFAGHPVLGTAFVLAAPLQLPEIVLETGKGRIPVRLEREEDRISFGWMTQPIPRIEL